MLVREIVEDSSDGSVVQRRGRFKVTSADLSPKNSTNSFFNPVSGNSAGQGAQNITAASVLPSLQCILQQNNMQRSSGNSVDTADAVSNDSIQASPLPSRQGELMSQIIHMQQRIGSLVEELQRQKLKNAQVSALAKKQ
ncbi:hypothetical protein V2J09_005533 [Rumex salicifolius]